MLNEKIMQENQNPLTIMPEDFYHNTLRKDFIEVLTKVKFDPILTATIEKTMNKADSSSINKQYSQLQEDLQPLATALLGKTYQKSDDFIRADEDEKVIVRKLTKDVQDLLMIIKCTKEPEVKEKSFSRERLNYDSTKKENLISGSEESTFKRERIPNIE